MAAQYIEPGTRLSLWLSEQERNLVRNLAYVEPDLLEAVTSTPSDAHLLFDLDQLDALLGCVAAEANHTDNTTQRNQLDAICERIDELLDQFTDEDSDVADRTGAAAPGAGTSIVVPQQVPPEGYLLPTPLTPSQRERVLDEVSLSESLVRKLRDAPKGDRIVMLTWDELNELHDNTGTTFHYARGNARGMYERIMRNLANLMGDYGCGDIDAAPPRREADRRQDAAYVLQVTLEEIRPLVWRRLVVPDCSLAELHEFLQVAMGWESTHLYCFEVGDIRYSDARWSEGDDDDADAGVMLLSEVVERLSGARTFGYRYDFGDDWRHTITVEKISDRASHPKIPCCLQGQRACPPEDVGGVMGYEEYVEAISDPDHESYAEMLEWRGAYDPARFNRGRVNQRLRRFR